jgi:beta-mannosidase
MTDWFRLPTAFDKMLWLSQILQGLAIKYAVEHWRRNMPRTMGAIYWQLNDCWPVASWASIDYFGRWKALHYMARDFFAPLLLSGVEDIERGTVEVWVTSDFGKAVDAKIRWTLTDLDGAALASGEKDVTIEGRKSALVETLNLKEQIDAVGTRNALLWMSLVYDNMYISNNLVLFARPKHLELRTPTFKVHVWDKEANQDGFLIGITADCPSLYTWVSMPEIDASYSSNFFHMMPGALLTLRVTGLPEGTTADDLRRQLKVQSLVDTYR